MPRCMWHSLALWSLVALGWRPDLRVPLDVIKGSYQGVGCTGCHSLRITF